MKIFTFVFLTFAISTVLAEKQTFGEWIIRFPNEFGLTPNNGIQSAWS